jgi:hypothetical protein
MNGGGLSHPAGEGLVTTETQILALLFQQVLLLRGMCVVAGQTITAGHWSMLYWLIEGLGIVAFFAHRGHSVDIINPGLMRIVALDTHAFFNRCMNVAGGGDTVMAGQAKLGALGGQAESRLAAAGVRFAGLLVAGITGILGQRGMRSGKLLQVNVTPLDQAGGFGINPPTAETDQDNQQDTKALKKQTLVHIQRKYLVVGL